MNPIQAQISGAMSVLSTWDKADAYKSLIPHEVKGGRIYNVKGNVIGSCDSCEDTIIVPKERLENLLRVTVKTQREIFGHVNQWMEQVFNPDGETAKAIAKLDESDDVPDEKATESSDSEEKTDEIVKNDMVVEVESLLYEGNIKKAKKELKRFKGDIPSDEYKRLKKLIKEAKNG